MTKGQANKRLLTDGAARLARATRQNRKSLRAQSRSFTVR
jgi:hypothetical protein